MNVVFTNYIFIDTSASELREIMKEIKNDEYGLGTIDFNKIIECPKSLLREDPNPLIHQEAMTYYCNNNGKIDLKSDEYINLSDSTKHLIKNLSTYGHVSWYTWSISNWGTQSRGDLYLDNEEYIPDDVNSLPYYVYCNTINTLPIKIVIALSKKYPDIIITHKYHGDSDEDLMGIVSYMNGNIISLFIPMTVEAMERFFEEINDSNIMNSPVDFIKEYSDMSHCCYKFIKDISDIV